MPRLLHLHPDPLHPVSAAFEAEFDRLMAAGDNIGALALLVQEAGGVLRLHGQPVTAAELRAGCEDSLVRRLEALDGAPAAPAGPTSG